MLQQPRSLTLLLRCGSRFVISAATDVDTRFFIAHEKNVFVSESLHLLLLCCCCYPIFDCKDVLWSGHWLLLVHLCFPLVLYRVRVSTASLLVIQDTPYGESNYWAFNFNGEGHQQTALGQPG